MNSKSLLRKIKCSIREIEPNADIILYGSRSRKDANEESDWDLLILVDGCLNDKRIDQIRHKLYEIEWDTGEIVSSIVRTRENWSDDSYKSLPFYKNVQIEGILL